MNSLVVILIGLGAFVVLLLWIRWEINKHPEEYGGIKK